MKSKTIIFLFLPLLIFAQARKAEFKIHDRGVLWETMKDDGTIGAPDPTNRFQYYPGMDWPGGPNEMLKDDQRSYMVGAGLWIGGYHSDGSLFLTENGPFLNVDKSTFTLLEKTDNFIESSSFNPNDAEQIIKMNLTTSENIEVKRTSRVWSYPGSNNFILIEYEFVNKNSSRVNDIYFGFPYLIRPSYQDFVVHNGWGDDFNRTDEIVKYDAENKLLFAYDDTPNFSLPNDVGNYRDDKNELRTTGYAGFALVDAANAKNNIPQPSNIFYAQLLNNEKYFTLTSSSAANMYKILNGEDKTLQASGTDKLTPFTMISAGPYDIEANGTVKIVLAEAVAGISLTDALKGLASQALLPQGENLLKQSIAKAKNIYANNFVVNILPPPSPEMEIIPVPENQSITINWKPVEDSWNDPFTNTNDFHEYKLYRSSLSFIGPYELLKTIRPGRTTDRDRYYDSEKNKWVFEDRTISLGAGYFYAVTSVDKDGNESWMTNRNEEPVHAIRNPAENALNVKVFPNPFKKVSGFPVSGSENSIVWTNLPAECKVRIYTSNGELIKTMEHKSQLSGEETWDQLTDARQRTSPGIYFWTVESSVGNAKGTLLIIK
ncbi:MAG: hypothetical protein HYS25_12015 [Ignavibacteriales bacterium]|nr:hypothetical protein [Ignavibacteriales bacterium]